MVGVIFLPVVTCRLFGQSVFCIVIEKVLKEYRYRGGGGLAFEEFWVSFET